MDDDDDHDWARIKCGYSKWNAQEGVWNKISNRRHRLQDSLFSFVGTTQKHKRPVNGHDIVKSGPADNMGELDPPTLADKYYNLLAINSAW